MPFTIVVEEASLGKTTEACELTATANCGLIEDYGPPEDCGPDQRLLGLMSVPRSRGIIARIEPTAA
jgi:hypothetical protein